MSEAKQLLERHGQELIGKTVLTQPVGSWPGGLAEVTEILPDPKAPEILFQVKSLAGHGEIGVFDDEVCEVFSCQ